MLYHNSNILLFYNVFDFALLTSISQSFNSSFFFLTYHMKDTEYSVKSLTALYTLSSPTENYPWLLWNLGHEIQKKKFV